MNMQSDFTLRPVLAGTDPATQYADLLMYGVVGLAAPVETFAPVLEAATWWVEGTPKATPAFHEISSKLRNVVLKTGAPVADRRLLGAMVALGQEKNHPEHCVVVLPMPQTPESIAEHLTRTATKEIQHRIQMLREHRRQQLGLSARLEASQIDDAIYRAFIVPSAEVAFAHLFPEATCGPHQHNSAFGADNAKTLCTVGPPSGRTAIEQCFRPGHAHRISWSHIQSCEALVAVVPLPIRIAGAPCKRPLRGNATDRTQHTAIVPALHYRPER